MTQTTTRKRIQDTSIFQGIVEFTNERGSYRAEGEPGVPRRQLQIISVHKLIDGAYQYRGRVVTRRNATAISAAILEGMAG